MLGRDANKKLVATVIFLLLAGIAVLAVIFFRHYNIGVLNPKGQIASKERGLIIFATLLSLLVIVPVYVMAFSISWRYRETNTKPRKYSPDWDHSLLAETIWWLIPTIIILILSVVTWRSTHELDPSKSLASSTKPITIQVVALQWKWLFIYPDQGIATVNYVQFPINTPINFEITADAPMNSFWIPQLSGQMYAMSGMSTSLHMEASDIGKFNGSSSNISGEGFAGMKFVAQASTSLAFQNWLQFTKQTPRVLNTSEYNILADPSENEPISYYGSAQAGLYNSIVSKFTDPTYKVPSSQISHTHSEEHS